MHVTVSKITGADLLKGTCESTMHNQVESKMTPLTIYNCEHSPIRSQMFVVEMIGIPNFVSVHLVRHNIGVQHFVQTMRVDRGAEQLANRLTPTNHTMILNAQTLINMARKRLCYKASKETREVFNLIVDAVALVDEDLPKFLEPECIYRGGFCHEPKTCGKMPDAKWVSPKSREFKRYGK
jgi:hypothetical protein